MMLELSIYVTGRGTSAIERFPSRAESFREHPARLHAGCQSPRALCGVDARPPTSCKPCRGLPDIFRCALGLGFTFSLLHWGAPWLGLALNLGSPADF